MSALPPNQPQFPGFKVMLMGPSGTGKTYSIASLVETGIDVFYADLDRSLESLVGYWTDKGQPIPPNLHWHYLQRKTPGFGALQKMADAVGKFDMPTLAKMKDNDRSLNNQFETFLGVMNNFTDQRDGKSYGPVDSWGTDRVFVLDSLTALNTIVFDMVVGARAMRDKPDYGIAQTNLSNFLERLLNGCTTNVVLIAHVERQVDEVLGGIKLMPVTIGQAMKSTITIPFSDVILTSRNGTEWTWDTANGQADLKTRNLPYASKLPPSFKPIYEKWSTRKKAAENTSLTN